jgi:hypothetical protein
MIVKHCKVYSDQNGCLVFPNYYLDVWRTVRGRASLPSQVPYERTTPPAGRARTSSIENLEQAHAFSQDVTHCKLKTASPSPHLYIGAFRVISGPHLPQGKTDPRTSTHDCDRKAAASVQMHASRGRGACNRHQDSEQARTGAQRSASVPRRPASACRVADERIRVPPVTSLPRC